MKLNNNLSIVVFTHSNVSDVWPIFFGELKLYLPYLDVNVFCNIDEYEPFTNEYRFIKYDNEAPYFEKYCECLKQVNTPYVLALFEDHILYDKVEETTIEKLLNFLIESDHSFLRLIKTDIHTVIPIDGQSDIFLNPTKQDYFFSMQPTIWKKDDLIQILEDSKIKSIFDEMKVSDSLRKLNKTGSYVYKNEKQVGKNHCESSTFPHNEIIARGKWLLSLYPNHLQYLFNKYKINPEQRGIK